MVDYKAAVRSLDVAIGVVDSAVGVAAVAPRRAGRALQGLAASAVRPPRLAREVRRREVRPARWVTRWRQDGEARRVDLLAELSRRLDRLLPQLVGEVLRRVEPTELVLRYVDLDRAVSAVDLDAAAARLDVQKCSTGSTSPRS